MEQRTVYKELPCRVEPVEMLDYGKKLSHQIDKVAAIQAAKKQSASEFKAREEEAQADVAATSKVISTGIVYREVECFELFDHARGVVDTYRYDTSEFVESRRMKDYERQKAIPFDEPTDEGEGTLEPEPEEAENDNDNKETEQEQQIDDETPTALSVR